MVKNARGAVGGLLILLVSICSLGTFSVGQTVRTAYAKIPFEFWVGDTRLPAGKYKVTHAILPTLVIFSSKKTKAATEAYMLPVDEEPVNESEAKLIFSAQKGNYYLYEIRGRFGTRIMSAQLGIPEPKGDERVEVSITYR